MENINTHSESMSAKLSFILVFAVICVFSLPSWAAQPRLLEVYGDWDAYAYEEQEGKVCFMISKPKKHEGNYKARGDIHTLITHRPGEGAKNVFSYIAGYTYKPASDATLEIDGQKFVLFTKDDMAWALNSETDDAIARAIRSGTTMVVTGTSSKGTVTKDTYSLNGSSAAYERISKECGT